MEEISALTFYFLPHLSLQHKRAALQHYGSAEALLADRGAELPALRATLAATSVVERAREQATQEWELCQRHGVRVLPLTCADFPCLLRDETVTDAPIVLFYKGQGSPSLRRSLSIVGTRHITAYGQDFTERLVSDLAGLLPDLAIVSGLAYGVDICAHRAALAHRLPTFGVVAHGLGTLYPSSHRHTAEALCERGGLFSEFPFRTPPDRGRFIQRNRIIAALSAGTLVVESAHHGGALVTARHAASYQRLVMALPGRVGDEYSEGCLELLSERKAVAVVSASNLVDLMGWKEAAELRAGGRQLFPRLTPEQQRVVDTLSLHADLTFDALAELLGLPLARLNDLVFDLEAQHVVRSLPGNRLRCVLRQ